ncbi:hypothetical protein A3C17_00895 [Candidatus Uhrbacteria bacterium RIFCSPHIGHO2_02_FULL_53_13]|uniref:DUF4012 domain-containing protein n=1 Tax=Candidatus Uhrbacteria bacterium RIFCSPHIGHO2_02_FULL_53_13 TaxID=1802389 RepID=A0A1F7U0Y7_9BACT|nr:MAG: hypothetical protein A3C17_00895 [Candidatus Uhrbacteria bacterium RIFCSPHIGHO2_02_FULL_53_13]
MEDIVIDGECFVAIEQTPSSAAVRMQCDMAHPVSPHLVTLADAFIADEQPRAYQNLLEATPALTDVDAEEPSTLHIQTHHIAKQLDQNAKTVISSRHLERPSHANSKHHAATSNITDPVFEELTIEHLLLCADAEQDTSIATVFDDVGDEAPETAKLALDEEQETAELTLDDLLDDIAIAEELADLPKSAAHKRAARPTRAKRTLPIGWGKVLASFIGLSFGIVLPLQAMTTFSRTDTAKADVVDRGMSGIGALSRAVQSASVQDFRQATAEFDRAAHVFGLANDELRAMNAQLLGIADVLPNTRKEVQAARHLLKAGEASARAASTLTNGLSTVANRSGEHATDAISLLDVFVENALPDFTIAYDHLSAVPQQAIPYEHRETLQEATARSSQLLQAMNTFHESAGAIKTFLGHQQTQRYLILFQNNTELRPTGGFWGSFAEVDLLNGELQSMRVPGGGTYEMQGQLQAFVHAPEPLRLVGARWEFQDANWFPDFPTSAQKAMWFYEQSGGPTVDGVIAINATWVSELIAATGPIELAEQGKIIDSENFLFETQKHVELEYDKEANRPKAIIGDMASVLIDRLSSAEGEDFLKIAELLSEGLSDQDIQIYHRDPNIQSAIQKLGWDGSVLGNAGDYFMLVHTNIAGGKTDGVIDDDVELVSRMRDDGRIENTARITRTHHGLKSSLFSGTNNVSFTRIFVPRGSELMSVEGAVPPNPSLFESDASLSNDPLLSRVESATTDPQTGAFTAESFGKTSFGDWMQTEPGTSSTLTFTYLLPQAILEEPRDTALSRFAGFVGVPPSTRHSLLVQKQSGVEFRKTAYTFIPNESLRPVWSSEETLTQFTLDQNTDGYFGLILESM